MSLLLALQSGAPPAITGTASIVFAVTVPAASAIERFVGTGASTFTVTVAAAQSIERFVGTAAEVFAVTAPAATGLERFTGSASVPFAVTVPLGTGTIPVPPITGTGAIIFAVTGVAGGQVSAQAGGGLPGRRRPQDLVRRRPPRPLDIVGDAAVTFRVTRVQGQGFVEDDIFGLEESDEMLLELV